MFTMLIGLLFVMLDRAKQIYHEKRTRQLIQNPSNIVRPHAEQVA